MWKATVLFVVNRLGILNKNSESFGGTLTYLYRNIKNVVNRLCANYQEPGNSNIHSVLMMWCNLFGVIFEAADK